MVNFECQICNYCTPVKCNYMKHMNTKKHLKNMTGISLKCGKNVEKCGKNVEKSIKSITKQSQKELILFEKVPQNICKLCCKTFSRNDSLQRHLSVCKLNNYSNKFQQIPKKMKNEQKNVNNSSFQCQFCQSY